MHVTETSLEGVLLLDPLRHSDARGYFVERYHEARYQALLGDHVRFVQDNLSYSHQYVVRGLHFQCQYPQGKLIEVLQGRVFDVVADVRMDSSQYGQWQAFILDAQQGQQLWVPPGYAHGFCVLSESALLAYRCTEYYHPEDESGVRWDCPRLGIDWPISTTQAVVSAKDAGWCCLP